MADQLSSRVPSVKWSALFFLGIIVLWQLLLPALKLPYYLLPTPLAIVEEFQKRGGFIFANALPTFYETMDGFLIGSAVRIVCGLGIVYSRFIWITVCRHLVVMGLV